MRGHKERGWTDLAKACAVVVALLCVPFAVAAFDTGVLPGPAGGAAFTATGGTVTQPVVFTGDNSGGTGTVRIRPSDEDLQVALCEASNNASPEVCSSVQHYNTSAITSSMLFGTNLYLDSSSLPQRHNTGFGAAYIQTVASSTVANTGIYTGVYGTGGTLTSLNVVAATGASTATTFIGASPGATVGTMTLDVRGPILNGGSATCNGILAGYECHNDDALFYSTNGTVSTMATSMASITGMVFLNAAGTQAGIVAYGNSAVSDADYASRVLLRSSGDPISLNHVTDVAAGSVHTEFRDNSTGTGVVLMDLLGNGTVRPLLYGSQSNCSDGAGAAACSAAPAGSVVIDDGATTVVVSTTAVTANSQILLTYDSSLGTKLGVTCNTNIVQPTVSARTAATSFTITISADPATANPACISYFIVN